MVGRGGSDDAVVLMESPTQISNSRSSLRARHGRWLTAFLTAVVLGMLAVAPAAAASLNLVPGCSGVNIRMGTSTSSPIAVKLGLSATLTVTGSVSGSRWGTSCPTWKSGSSWYTITAINGQPVASLYGVAQVYGATGVLTAPVGGGSLAQTPTLPPAPDVAAPATPAPTPTDIPASAPAAAPAAPASPAPVAQSQTTYVPGCSGVNFRTGTSTSSTIKAKLSPPTTLTVSGTVNGSSWRATCPTSTSGSRWYVISAINGQSVSALHGVSALYVATGVVAATTVVAAPAIATPEAPATPTPAPTPAPTPDQVAVAPALAAPAPAALAGLVLVPACDGVNLRASASTSAPIKVKLAINSSVGVAGTVTNASWSAACPTAKSGSTWYQVTSVNGQAVSTLYGVSAIYAATGVLTSPTTPSSSGVTTLGTSTVFYGRGYGHGVGLSQYGALGRAQAGQSAAEILAHYYANTTIGSVPLDLPIRVLLLDNFVPSSTKPLLIYGRGGTWTVSGVGLELPADARLQLFPADPAQPAGRLVIDTTDAQVLFDGPAPSDFRVVPSSDATTIQLFSKPTTNDLFRGTLRVIASGSTVDVVNELPLESYLRGVVPGEMPTSWPLEARIAQTIAARSYAANHLVAGGTFDVYDDTRSQVYLGVRREHPEADAVVASSAGQVLLSGASIVNAMFHSSDGGATEDNENVFVSSTGARIAGPVGYLRGSSDRDPSGVSFDAAAPFATWQTGAYSAAQLSAIFASDARTNVGTLTALDLRNRGVSGRLISVTLIGSLGTRTVSGTVFAAAFNAGKPSTDARIRGTLVDVAPIP